MNSGLAAGCLTVAIGNRLLMTEQGVKIGEDVEEYMQGHEKAGRTCVVVAVNAKPLACIAVADPLKPEAKGVVAALHQQVCDDSGFVICRELETDCACFLAGWRSQKWCYLDVMSLCICLYLGH